MQPLTVVAVQPGLAKWTPLRHEMLRRIQQHALRVIERRILTAHSWDHQPSNHWDTLQRETRAVRKLIAGTVFVFSDRHIIGRAVLDMSGLTFARCVGVQGRNKATETIARSASTVAMAECRVNITRKRLQLTQVPN